LLPFGPLPTITFWNGLGFLIGLATVSAWLVLFKAILGPYLDLSTKELAFFFYMGLAVVVISFFIEYIPNLLVGSAIGTILVAPLVEEPVKAGLTVYTFKSEKWGQYAQKNITVWAIFVGLATAAVEGLWIIYAFGNVYHSYLLLLTYSVVRILPMHPIGTFLSVKGYTFGTKSITVAFILLAVCLHSAYNYIALPGVILVVDFAWVLLACVLLAIVYLISTKVRLSEVAEDLQQEGAS
jgi:RsiW-degrading membrane proteinase PrsW (M82 family)